MIIPQKEIQLVIRKLSTKHFVSEKEVERIIWSQFKLVKQVIESAEKNNIPTFKVVSLKNLGKFVPNKRMIEHIIKNTTNGNRSNKDI